jgi:hypothetical protein
MGRHCRLLLAALLLCLAWHGNVAMAQEVPTTVGGDSIATVSQPKNRGGHHDRRSLNVSDSAKHAAGHPVRVVNAAGDTIILASVDSIQNLGDVEILMDSAAVSPTLGKTRVFNPDPQRALWLSALCPGLGQIYNRRYWKLPIVVGSFVGLSYGASWNNRMYRDYSKAYRDVMDDDPDTRSYMEFFPPTVNEGNLDQAWLQRVMKSKRDYYRRYREICVIAMVGVYLINIVDAYVDASLAHFDITPDLTLDVAPTAIDNTALGGRMPSLGLQCAISFYY